MERHIKVETLPSMQHVNAFHSYNLTLTTRTICTRPGRKGKTRRPRWKTSNEIDKSTTEIKFRSRHKPTQSLWVQITQTPGQKNSYFPSGIRISSHLESTVAEETAKRGQGAVLWCYAAEASPPESTCSHSPPKVSLKGRLADSDRTWRNIAFAAFLTVRV